MSSDETTTTGRHEPHGNAPWPCENARLRERVAVLELSMRLAATRMDILVGRMRGCHEVTGMHELLDEAEMFVQEARAALPQADETGGAR